jgi:recombinational DNA repair protein (RecF pathway)
MSKCANCGTTLSCGCQKRSFPDGRAGCSKCINTPAKSETKYQNLKDSAPIINAASLNKKD